MNAASLQCGYFAYAYLALDLEIFSYLWRNLSYGCILFAFFLVFGPVRFVSLMNAAAVVTAATQNCTDVFQHALHLHYSIKVWIIEIVHRLSFNYITLCAVCALFFIILHEWMWYNEKIPSANGRPESCKLSIWCIHYVNIWNKWKNVTHFRNDLKNIKLSFHFAWYFAQAASLFLCVANRYIVPNSKLSGRNILTIPLVEFQQLVVVMCFSLYCALMAGN